MATSAPIQSIVDHKIVSISVDLGVTTPDGLRHIDFGLEKDTGDDDSVIWTINFAFQTRNPAPKPWEGRGAAFFGLAVLKSFP
jgi:hypothetical protein